MKQRLQKCISAAGIASRRAAENMISAGRVTVNGLTASLGDSADPETDDIRVDGVPLPKSEEKIYLMLHKPRGYVTTLSDEQGRRTVAELVAAVGVRVYPVGRLDLDSEGLLLMTNDGEAANALMHPSHVVDKVYHVEASGGDLESAAETIRTITDLDGERVSPAEVTVLDACRLAVTIHEGKNRQVRRLCAKAGLTVHRLKRVSEGALKLGNLPPRGFRYLNEQEISYIRSLIK